jgi:hypothetical protein
MNNSLTTSTGELTLPVSESAKSRAEKLVDLVASLHWKGQYVAMTKAAVDAFAEHETESRADERAKSAGEVARLRDVLERIDCFETESGKPKLLTINMTAFEWKQLRNEALNPKEVNEPCEKEADLQSKTTVDAPCVDTTHSTAKNVSTAAIGHSNAAATFEPEAAVEETVEVLSNPNEMCSCGHTREFHGHILGVHGRGECSICLDKARYHEERCLRFIPTATAPLASQGETPEVDAYKVRLSILGKHGAGGEEWFVPAHRARKLEHERDQARRDRVTIENINGRYLQDLAAARSSIESLRNERDQARKMDNYERGRASVYNYWLKALGGNYIPDDHFTDGLYKTTERALSERDAERSRAESLAAELAKAKEDTARLEWLFLAENMDMRITDENGGDWVVSRECIDAARAKEQQP